MNDFVCRGLESCNQDVSSSAGEGLHFDDLCKDVRLFDVTLKDNADHGIELAGALGGELQIWNLTAGGNANGTVHLACNTVTIFNGTLDATPFASISQWGKGTILKSGGVTGAQAVKLYYGTLDSDSSVRHTAAGVSWKFSPTNSGVVLRKKLASIAVFSGNDTTIGVYARRSDTGISGRLLLPGKQLSGITGDVSDDITVNADLWEQLAVNFTPARPGSSTSGSKPGAGRPTACMSMTCRRGGLTWRPSMKPRDSISSAPAPGLLRQLGVAWDVFLLLPRSGQRRGLLVRGHRGEGEAPPAASGALGRIYPPFPPSASTRPSPPSACSRCELQDQEVGPLGRSAWRLHPGSSPIRLPGGWHQHLEYVYPWQKYLLCLCYEDDDTPVWVKYDPIADTCEGPFPGPGKAWSIYSYFYGESCYYGYWGNQYFLGRPGGAMGYGNPSFWGWDPGCNFWTCDFDLPFGGEGSPITYPSSTIGTPTDLRSR
jgi:hypothetical protein